MINHIYYCTAPGCFSLKTNTLPDETPLNYVLIKYLYCGICGGDYSVYIGRRQAYPISLGHEFIGTVLSVGPNVINLHPNQYVISDFNFRCGECEFCKNNHSHLCHYNNIQKFSNRAFAEYGLIHKDYLYPVTIKNKIEIACFIEPLSCILHAFDIWKIPYNYPILINGVGSIGTMAVFYLCSVLQCKNVYINDINTLREEKIMKLFSVKNYKDYPQKFEYIFESTNSIDGIKFSLDTAISGTYMCIMSHLYGEDTSFIYERICQKEIQPVFPLRNGDPQFMFQAINYIAKYWENSYNILYQIDTNLKKLFEEKPQNPFNKQIVDLEHLIWDEAD